MPAPRDSIAEPSGSNAVVISKVCGPSWFVLWDKTVGNIAVKGVSTLNSQPSYLNTNRPEIKSLRDFTDKDRIAIPSLKSSAQAVFLMLAAEKEWGEGQFARLDPMLFVGPMN